ncbi:hypothetical protein C2S51_029977 [Perilla frutescens var. frutescens]|nr:hypothetical protein C2S51_029977 [Perilla frutescens var. frutescens]
MADFVEGCHLILENGKSSLFWLDNWLGYRIVDKLEIPAEAHANLLDKMADFLKDGVWYFMEIFLLYYPEIVWDILQVPITNMEDERIWKRSVHGEVTTKVAKLCNRNHYATVSWGKWLWHRAIPVRRSIVCWRAIPGRLPMMEKWRHLSFQRPLFYVLCHKKEEYFDHLFYSCRVVRAVWKWLFRLFQRESLEFSSFFRS